MKQSNHGGSRPNAGRKPSAEPKKPFPLRVTESEKEKLIAYLSQIRNV